MLGVVALTRGEYQAADRLLHDSLIMWRVVEGGADGHDWVPAHEQVARRGGA